MGSESNKEGRSGNSVYRGWWSNAVVIIVKDHLPKVKQTSVDLGEDGRSVFRSRY